MAKGYAIVQGSKVAVMVGRTLTEVMAAAQKRNRFAPLERARVAACTFVYKGIGEVEQVKVGRFIT